jgi:tetratricopeptide (TPR) repeat protein
MISNTQIEIALDDFFAGHINRSRLDEIMQFNGITDSEPLVKEHSLAVQIIRQYNLLEQVQRVHEQMLSEYQQSHIKSTGKLISMKTTRRFYMNIAAGFFIILSGAVMVLYFNSTGKDFYQSHYTAYNLSETRSIGAEPETELVKAYKSGDFANVISQFSKIANPGNRELFFAGNAYLETGNPVKAMELFQTIITRNKTNGELLYQDEAEYYLAMAYLSNNETGKALPILTAISNEPAHTYHNKVSKIALLRMKWLGHK